MQVAVNHHLVSYRL